MVLDSKTKGSKTSARVLTTTRRDHLIVMKKAVDG